MRKEKKENPVSQARFNKVKLRFDVRNLNSLKNVRSPKCKGFQLIRVQGKGG